jgi:hypothetical protein
MAKPTDRDDGFNNIVKMPECDLEGCGNRLSAVQITEGQIHCSDDCYAESLYVGGSSLFDDPEATDVEDEDVDYEQS